jgi:Holliday junction resolvasome RuvABC endonuclease subunit
MAHMGNRVLLGISPGTRIIGLAVLYNGELVEWKVKTFKETWSIDKRTAILSAISRLCGYHGVQVVVLKKINPLKSSLQLDKLVDAIIQQAEREKIKVVQYSLEDLDFDMRSSKKQTKSSISEKVVSRHPQLKLAYIREQNNRKEYYTKMFEAIAMAERYRG